VRYLLTLLAVTVIAAPAGALAGSADRIVDRGIVQSVTADRLVIRALDGSERPVVLQPGTRVVLNGAPVSLAAIRPGLVAEVVSDELGTARVVRAFGRAATDVVRGIVLEITTARLRVRQAGGQAVNVPLTPRTRFRVGPIPARLRVVRAGHTVEAILAGDGTARAIVVRRGQRLR
jgi:hypothetical protein